jgi:hypothetical protein
MLTYYFYSKSDPKKEVIGQIQSQDLDTAVEYFLQRKNLVRKQFFDIYGIGIKNLN